MKNSRKKIDIKSIEQILLLYFLGTPLLIKQKGGLPLSPSNFEDGSLIPPLCAFDVRKDKEWEKDAFKPFQTMYLPASNRNAVPVEIVHGSSSPPLS